MSTKCKQTDDIFSNVSWTWAMCLYTSVWEEFIHPLHYYPICYDFIFCPEGTKNSPLGFSGRVGGIVGRCRIAAAADRRAAKLLRDSSGFFG